MINENIYILWEILLLLSQHNKQKINLNNITFIWLYERHAPSPTIYNVLFLYYILISYNNYIQIQYMYMLYIRVYGETNEIHNYIV